MKRTCLATDGLGLGRLRYMSLAQIPGPREVNLSECVINGGEALGQRGDHGPQDHGLVPGGQPFVVPDGAPVAGDP